MNAREFLQGLKGNYPVGLHPSDQGGKDLLRCLRKLSYTDDQMQQIYDKTLMRCEYFPRPADISAVILDLGLPSIQQQVKEIVWKSFMQDGKLTARKMTEQETRDWEYERRRERDGIISWEDGGGEYFMAAFEAAGGKISSSYVDPRLLMKKLPARKIQPEIADYDDTDYGVEVEFAEETSWDEL